MSRVLIDEVHLRTLFDAACEGDAAGRLGECEADPCPVCSALEAAWMALQRAERKR